MWNLSPAALGCIVIAGLSSCTSGVEHPSVPKTGLHSPGLDSSEKTPELEFRYDPKRDDCVNASGASGLNRGYLGECGEIENLNLVGLDLRGRSFAGLRATKVNWSNANLKNSVFQGAWIVDSSFDCADLSDADFRSTLLENSIFKGAKLGGADFREATWEGMDGDHLEGATFSSTTRLPGSIEDYEELGLRLLGADVPELNWTDAQGQVHRLHFDEALSPLVRGWVTLDLQKLMSLKIDAREDSAFAQFFGGTTQESLLRYFFTRITAIVRPSFDDFQVLTEENPKNEFPAIVDPPESSTLASNLGTALLLENIYTKQKMGIRKSAQIAGLSIVPEPGQNGILMLGTGYTRSEADQILRLSTLVHEARHTDCPTPPSADVLTPLIESETRVDGMSQLQCGYFHIPCPKGSELEGILACDDRFDGAYGAASAFGLALDLACKNCSERERARARITWLENKNRVFPKVE